MNNRKYLLNIKTWFIILVHYFLYFTFLSRTNTIYAKAGKGNDSSFFLTTTTISSQTSRYLICILHLLPHRCLSLSVKLSDLCSMRLVLISVSVFRMNVNYIFHSMWTAGLVTILTYLQTAISKKVRVNVTLTCFWVNIQ